MQSYWIEKYVDGDCEWRQKDWLELAEVPARIVEWLSNNPGGSVRVGCIQVPDEFESDEDAELSLPDWLNAYEPTCLA